MRLDAGYERLERERECVPDGGGGIYTIYGRCHTVHFVAGDKAFLCPLRRWAV